MCRSCDGLSYVVRLSDLAEVATGSFPIREATMRFRITISCVLGCALIAAACADFTGPDRTAVKRYVGFPPGYTISTVTDWYTCWSSDGGQTWTCAYSHTEGGGNSEPDYWDVYNGFNTTADCSRGPGAGYCDNNFQPEGSPYTDPREVARSDDWDDHQVLSIPTCPASSSAHRTEKAYCAGRAPNSTQLTRLRAALERMRQKGGECVALADIGDSLLNRDGAFRVFPQASYPFSGAAPLNGGSSGPNSWAILSADVVDRLYDSTHKGRIKNPNTNLWYDITLQSALAHELDHLAGRMHIEENGDVNPVFTANTRACSDIDMGPGTLRPGH